MYNSECIDYKIENSHNNEHLNNLKNEKVKICHHNKNATDNINSNNKDLSSKIYNSIFNANNKQVYVIKPFPIIKGDYFNTSLLKTSSSDIESNNDPMNLHTQKELSSYNNSNSNLLKDIPKDIFKGISNKSSSNSSYTSNSDTSSFESNTMCIDLQMFMAKDYFNRTYLALKDNNDISLCNLLSILENPENASLLYDERHYMENKCSNHKYLSHELNTKNSEYSTVEHLKRYKIVENITIEEISFNINQQAFYNIKSNSLIVESESFNRLPIKNTPFFAVSSEKLETGS